MKSSVHYYTALIETNQIIILTRKRALTQLMRIKIFLYTSAIIYNLDTYVMTRNVAIGGKSVIYKVLFAFFFQQKVQMPTTSSINQDMQVMQAVITTR